VESCIGDNPLQQQQQQQQQQHEDNAYLDHIRYG